MRLTLCVFLSTFGLHVVGADETNYGGGQNFSVLLDLASSAGINIPTTDPGLLLSLGPIAARIGSYLPTAPVLSALQTAAPPDFLSRIVHEPAYASSFVSEFAAGSSPSWFLALPSDVKDYLHTYSDYVGVATEARNVESIIASATTSSTASIPTMSATASDPMDATATLLSSTSGTAGITSPTNSIPKVSGTTSPSLSEDRTSSEVSQAVPQATSSTSGATSAIVAKAAAMLGALGLVISI